jgi:hypothetical protein
VFDIPIPGGFFDVHKNTCPFNKEAASEAL